MRLRKGIVTLILLSILINLTACISFESDVFARRSLPEATVAQASNLVARSADQVLIEP